MNFNWPGTATFAAVVLAWVGIWLLRKRKVNFSLVALFALAAGIPIGLVAGKHVGSIHPIGQIYINVLIACVAPLIFVSIVASITSLGSLAKLRSIGLRSIFWLLASNAVAVVLALGLGLAFQPGAGVHSTLGGVPAQTVEAQVQDFGQVFVGFFPTNVVESFGANDIIPIILIAVTLSVAYLSLAENAPQKTQLFRDGIEALKLVIFKAVGYVINLTPYAIVALTAHMVGSSTNLGPSFWSLVGLLALVWTACFVHAYGVNGVILNVFAGVSVRQFFRKIFPAQLTAFTTQSSVGTLPVTTRQLTHEVGVHPEIASFTAPLGTTIGMPGCAGIWPILIAIWGINAYDLSYSFGDYLVLALLAIFVSVGTAGVPGAATVAAATVLSAAGLPLEFVAVTIPISIIADTARTMSNVTAAAVSATVVARQTGLLDDEIFVGRKAFREEDYLPEAAAPPAVAAPMVAPVAPAAAVAHAASAAPVSGGPVPEPLWHGDPRAAQPATVARPVGGPPPVRRLAPHIFEPSEGGLAAPSADAPAPALAGASHDTNGAGA